MNKNITNQAIKIWMFCVQTWNIETRPDLDFYFKGDQVSEVTTYKAKKKKRITFLLKYYFLKAFLRYSSSSLSRPKCYQDSWWIISTKMILNFRVKKVIIANGCIFIKVMKGWINPLSHKDGMHSQHLKIL